MRKLGLPITLHVASARKAVNQIEPLYKDVQLSHALKRGGRLTAINTPGVIAGARAALAGVRERTKWR
jgi:hypothetical protein